MDQFEFFFTFYSLLLGLAAVEVLGGFAGFVRARALRRIEIRTVLLALLIFIQICATWIDAWQALRGVTIDLAGLWAPILCATCYYLAATVVFPSDPHALEHLGDYFDERRRFVMAMLIAADLLATWILQSIFIVGFNERPAVFWLWYVPYNLASKSTMIALLFARGRRTQIALLVASNLLFVIPYWFSGWLSHWVDRSFGPLFG